MKLKVEQTCIAKASDLEGRVEERRVERSGTIHSKGSHDSHFIPSWASSSLPGKPGILKFFPNRDAQLDERTFICFLDMLGHGLIQSVEFLARSRIKHDDPEFNCCATSRWDWFSEFGAGDTGVGRLGGHW
jgi:hypothetical protein